MYTCILIFKFYWNEIWKVKWDSTYVGLFFSTVTYPNWKMIVYYLLILPKKKYERYAFELYRSAQQHNKELTRKFFFLSDLYLLCVYRRVPLDSHCYLVVVFCSIFLLYINHTVGFLFWIALCLSCRILEYLFQNSLPPT